MHDSYILEGQTILDARLTDVIASRGTLHVFVEDGAEEFPLDGAREAASALIENCTSKAASVPLSGTTQCDLAAGIMKGAPDPDVNGGRNPGHWWSAPLRLDSLAPKY
ncbi:MAG TPA: hypothetical protein PKC22_09790 [Rhodocyclaceae bacterium]|nr:hypothetical protein [Rhodocyclaceae bacterium]